MSEPLLKPYYVYELVDPRCGTTFYVGKGKGQRALAHGAEAGTSTDHNEKLARIREIRAAGEKELAIVIGRYETEEQAYAVEATLIHWVYGFYSLTNVQGGHGGSTIRPNGAMDEIPGIDIPRRAYRQSGEYSSAMIRAREQNDTVSFALEIKRALEEELDVGFTEPDLGESNKTKIYSYFDAARLRIGITHTKNPTMWLAFEPTGKSAEEKDRFLRFAVGAELYITNAKNLARYPDYSGTREIDVIIREARKGIQLLEHGDA
ncbi:MULTISPECIES: GIY-YIG nuclease family protein [unclassified Halomonas]|uniref:LEM-3-like GIY-YIG domain-containing protein n=1 Tax=unclassified Halomonas TaxID=2609666 RepID=UPI0006975FCB|nr:MULTISPECIES: GIY-YIG nuclease family protein [unclassified Halomonas]MBR9878513.1 GIY-YIG nuclease family protein [Gammaproteobacteria bacterium]MBS8267337.1 GIY-YIG nuclease family protein [Halomonas litopenaei]MBY5941246.1 GIY-YIG nuclease family protein [Halomonas sp. DP5N14-9]MCO7216021.1 GIY-YIG nuclease family protein [Halomonas sp. OfavH-34-E]